MKYIVALPVVLILAGGLVAYSADGAVPGDMLYTVKTQINEPVLCFIFCRKDDGVSFNLHLLEERLAEIEVLLEKGTITQTEAQALQSTVLAQVSRTNQVLADAHSGSLTTTQTIALGTSLERLKSMLQTYRNSLNTLDDIAQTGEKRKLNPRGKTGPVNPSPVVVALEDTVEEVSEKLSDEEVVADIELESEITEEEPAEEVEEAPEQEEADETDLPEEEDEEEEEVEQIQE